MDPYIAAALVILVICAAYLVLASPARPERPERSERLEPLRLVPDSRPREAPATRYRAAAAPALEEGLLPPVERDEVPIEGVDGYWRHHASDCPIPWGAGDAGEDHYGRDGPTLRGRPPRRVAEPDHDELTN